MSPTLVSSNTDMTMRRAEAEEAEGHAQVMRCAMAGVTDQKVKGAEAALWHGSVAGAQARRATSPRGDHQRAKPLRAGAHLPLLLQPAFRLFLFSLSLAPSLPALPICAPRAAHSRHLCSFPPAWPLVSLGVPLESTSHPSPRRRARTPTSRLFDAHPGIALAH